MKRILYPQPLAAAACVLAALSLLPRLMAKAEGKTRTYYIAVG